MIVEETAMAIDVMAIDARAIDARAIDARAIDATTAVAARVLPRRAGTGMDESGTAMMWIATSQAAIIVNESARIVMEDVTAGNGAAIPEETKGIADVTNAGDPICSTTGGEDRRAMTETAETSTAIAHGTVMICGRWRPRQLGGAHLPLRDEERNRHRISQKLCQSWRENAA